jgi:aspartyl-tRNA(Asn)/glutamyl-tRNA(Gln) amidotransferase subunit B
MDWEIVIGLEIHVQLATQSKIFSGASTRFGAAPNTQACAIDLGMPGVLPVLNQEAVRMAILFGLACDCHIGRRSVFARKNYFYPDLPKGYQISQFELPVVGKGHLDIELPSGEVKRIGITRAHLEEDAGKSLHEDFSGMSGIDLNRAGTPLLEIVSEPDMRSSAEAAAYMKKIHSLVRYLGISDGNMQEGSLRCDANVSIRPKGEQTLGTRTELKNLNSFRFIEKAINIEVERQIDLIEGGGKVIQETRLYDPDKNETRAMRSKEEANDYRYFPDPDLLPVIIEEAEIDAIRLTLPELPDAKCQRFVDDFGLSATEAAQLTSNKEVADYFESVLSEGSIDPKTACSWINGELAAALNRDAIEIQHSPITAAKLAQILIRIQEGKITSKMAKDIVFRQIWEKGGDVDEIITQNNLVVVDQSELETIIDQIIANSPSQVEQFRSGKEKIFGYFVGQTLKATGGKADPAAVNSLLKAKLKG